MKVLVTGGNGKLAAYLIRALAADHELVLFARRRLAAEFANYPGWSITNPSLAARN